MFYLLAKMDIAIAPSLHKLFQFLKFLYSKFERIIIGQYDNNLVII